MSVVPQPAPWWWWGLVVNGLLIHMSIWSCNDDHYVSKMWTVSFWCALVERRNHRLHWRLRARGGARWDRAPALFAAWSFDEIISGLSLASIHTLHSKSVRSAIFAPERYISQNFAQQIMFCCVCFPLFWFYLHIWCDHVCLPQT